METCLYFFLSRGREHLLVKIVSLSESHLYQRSHLIKFSFFQTLFLKGSWQVLRSWCQLLKQSCFQTKKYGIETSPNSIDFAEKRKLAFCSHKMAITQAQASYCVVGGEQLTHNNLVLGPLERKSLYFSTMKKGHTLGQGDSPLKRLENISHVATKALSRSHTH